MSFAEFAETPVGAFLLRAGLPFVSAFIGSFAALGITLGGYSASISTLGSSLSNVENRLTGIETALRDLPRESSIDRLLTRLDEVERRIEGRFDRQSELIRSRGRLRILRSFQGEDGASLTRAIAQSGDANVFVSALASRGLLLPDNPGLFAVPNDAALAGMSQDEIEELVTAVISRPINADDLDAIRDNSDIPGAVGQAYRDLGFEFTDASDLSALVAASSPAQPGAILLQGGL